MKHLTTLVMPVLFGASTVVAVAQNQEVKGIVLSATDQQPLIGATVNVKGTTQAVFTGTDGSFTLKNVKPDAILQVRYIGFKSKEVSLSAAGHILLEEVANDLQEVVVTGYTTQRKADLTGAVAVVSTESLKNTAEPDPMRALQGKVSGMNISVNGSPSGTGTVRIRGIGSINTSQDPLYIVDGVPTTGALNSLNSNDIESIQVLKDAASASIYGSRAANGVIIITTKRGKKNEKINVDFSANLTTQFYTSQSKMKLLNTGQYATAMAQAALNDGIDPVAYASNYGLDLNAASGVPIRVWSSAQNQYVNYMVNGRYGGYINSKRTMLFSDTDWVNEISRTGVAQNYNLSLSQANEKHSSLFSLGYKKNAGIIRYTDFENIAARMNTAFHLNQYLSVGENFALTYTKQVDIAPMENALKMAPTVPVYEKDGRTFAGPVGGMSDRQNPMREAYDNRDNHLDFWRMFGNAYIDIKPLDGLLFRSNFGIDVTTSFINSITHTYASDIVNNNIAKTNLGQTNNVNYTWSNTLNYNFKAAEKHNFSVLLGSEINKQSVVDFSAYSEGYALEDVNYMWPNAATGVMKNSGAKFGFRLASFFGKVDYNYDNLVLASVTMRRDGSSRFGSNHRWGTFPAASLGFRLSELLKKGWMDDLKVRASWGKTGNQAIDNNAQFGLYVVDYGLDRVTSTAYDLYLQGSGTFPSGYRATQTANPNLKWETATQTNFGVDFTLFRNSLYGSIDAFVKNVDDMLINPGYLGAMGEGGATWQNGPSLRNWGMEFIVGYRKTLPNGLGLDVNANLDFFRNRVTWLPSTTTGAYAHTTTENLVQSRQPYGSIVGYVVDGLFQSQAEVNASGQPNARVGGLKYRDLDGKDGITAADQTWIYNPVPAFSYGLNIGLTYKNFDLSMFWQGVFDKDVYNNQKFQTDFWSITDAGSNKGSRLLGAWTTGNTSSSIPALTTNNTADEGRASTYYVENGSYLKLRSLQVGYRLPERVLSALRISNARFYISGQNLLTLKSSSLTCSDPENPDWNYPIASSISVGLQIMKLYHIAVATLLVGTTLTSCNDFLDYEPTGVVDQGKAFSDPQGMTTSAYAALGNDWYGYPFNLWPYGDLTSDDCLKGGSGTTDTDYHPFEVWNNMSSTIGHLDELWYHLYISVSRCNRALVSLEQYGESKLGKEEAQQRIAEVKFLRAHFYYKLATVFRKVPWIDEEVFKKNAQEKVKNDALTYEQLFEKIIADFQTAYDVLPDSPKDKGRVNKIAAASYLAKCYLALAWGDGYEKSTGVAYIKPDYMQKVVDYTDVVAASNYGYLEDFGDLFLPEYNNNKESIFAIQHSGYQDDNTKFGRANWSNTLNGCWGIWSCGWDFHKPSQDLVDAFKTKNGLPMFDDYHATPDHPVNGASNAQKWDPRLFHTVGMPSFPYKYEKEYTMTTANSRTPNTYGYYASLKEVTQRGKGETYNYPWQAFAKNEYVFRYTDVMLMRAEALIELGRLSEARTIINDIRQRAANSIGKHIAYAADQCEINLYPTTYFNDKETARKCLRWERRLEMAMEHERFFDLRRWGIASTTLNNYFKREVNDNYDGQTYAQYYKDAKFTPGKNEFFPVPYAQLFYIPGLYSQNEGYK